MIVDKIRRYVWLLDTIYRAGESGITFDEINEKWQRYDLLSKQKILSCMGNVEIIKPPSFRNEIKKEIERMREIYR